MRKAFFVLAVSSVALAGCIKHEVIPAPTPEVELDGHLEGTINGGHVELTENVDGYFVEASKTKIIVQSPALSSAVYYAEMKSGQGLVSVRVSLGSLMWDASVSSDPSVSEFNSFFTSPANLQPVYSANAANGFEVIYRDGEGNVWKSKDTDPGTAEFTNIVQESDGAGDYSKFRCTFACNVYRMAQVNPLPAPMTELTIPIQNVQFDAWFRR
jgi:hypothetical protein